MRLYSARWVLPISRPPISHGAVGVERGHIAYVGPRDAAPAAAQVVDLGNAFLLPGLVNAHTHLELTALRGYLEGADFRSWLLRLTTARAQALDDVALLASARLGIAEGLLAGITTYADTSATGVVLDALTQMGVRGISYQEVFGPHTAQCAEAISELRHRVSVLVPRASQLVRLGVSPHAPYTVSDDLYRGVAQYACDAGLPVAVHIAESREESMFVADASGPFAEAWRARGIPVLRRAATPISLLHATGILDTKPLLIHCVHLTHDDVAAIVWAQCSVAHCPASNAKLGHGIAPIAQLLSEGGGVAVGLGTDSVASNNRMDILDEARLAVLLARASQGTPGIDAHKALELATFGGARTLGLDSHIGSLEEGKAADLAAFHIDPARDEPVYDPETALLFAGAGRRAILVCVAGDEVVRDGRLLATLEEDVAVVRAAAERLARLALEQQEPRELDFTLVQRAGEETLSPRESER